MSMTPALAAPPTVLIVEGSSLLALDIVEVLQKAGYLTLETGHAEEALSFLRDWDVAAVIVDIDMHDGMDGLTMSHRIAEDYPDMPLVVVSGSAVPCKDFPPKAQYLTRPYETPAVLDAVTHLHPAESFLS